jgi:trehalose 6-phosphate synthase/phosphatase
MPRRQERPTLERGLERSAPVPSRLLIAANRLPLSVRVHQGEPELTASTGGLATGLRSPHEQGEGLWFGWPGPLTGLRARGRQRALAGMRERRFVPIELDAAEIEGFYNQFCNGVLWPVCHYLLDRLPLQGADWLTYRAVNERFAAAIAAEWRPGDLIWVHDFHLLLLPALLRERLPNARIGFFLHVPFPSSEVFRVLPWRDELLRGLLGADLIGFHTLGYLRHFAASLLRQLGFEVDIDRLLVDGREVRLTASPMGIDVAAFDQLTADPEVRAEAAAMRVQRGNGQLVLGIDRLDYTKGIPRRLLAFERLLEQRPTTAPPVQLMLVAAASREEVPEYRSFKRTVDELVGRINGRFGAPGSVPIHYINRSLDLRAVTTLYLAADVMLVTPLRDGLNLVAKEFVAARADDDGVLVLSEFAGVAAELADALPFNPYDVDGAAEALARALAMPPEERRQRMRSMRSAVRRHDVHGWVQSFLAELAQATPAIPTSFDYPAANAALAAVRRPLCLLLDYDGTLVDFSPHPDQGAPDNALRTLLQQLAARPDLHLHLVSGRPRTFLERHFGELAIGLHGEHGGVFRLAPDQVWQVEAPTTDWRERVQALLARIAGHIPGAEVEVKELSLAFHFRRVDRAFAAVVGKELRLHLLELLGNIAATVVEGDRVLEIRPQGVHKGRAVARALQQAPGASVCAIGDDRTDEDMFAATPADAITVRVGSRPTIARYRIADPNAARALLRSLLAPSPSRGDAMDLEARPTG